MKILCLSRAPLDYKGGIPAYCLNLYGNKKFDVSNYSYDIEKGIRNIDSRTIRGIKEKVFPSEVRFGTLALSKKYFLAIINDINKFDLVHLQHPDPFSAITIIFSKILRPRLKVIVTWHADVYSSYKYVSPILFVLDLIIYLLSTKIIFFTPSHLKTSLINKFFFLKKKSQIIPFCLDIKIKKDKYKRNKGISNKKTINVISIGRLVKYKGYEYAIKAFKNLDKNINYTIIGGGPLKKELNALIASNKLEGRISLKGEVDEDEKNKLLSNADIFLFPSISCSEAYGIVQIEAMAYGLPIINTFINNGVNFLVPPDVAITCKKKNSLELNHAIKNLITNETFYVEKSLSSINNLSRFKIDLMIKKYKKIIYNL